MQFGRYEITLHNHGYFRLDGGAMFGSVPKNLWTRSIEPDEENCIRLATRSLLLRDEERTILVDVGNGEKWDEKPKKIFAIENTPEDQLGFNKQDITDIVLTHLHFDHAAGVSRYNESGNLELCYPQARVHLQRANLENAKAPNVREQASYLESHVSILETTELNLLDGSQELFPDFWVHRVDGHTVGQQYIEVRNGEELILFPTDVCPTSHHLPVPYNMGYDICTQTILKEKEALLSYAMEKNATVVFEHDPDLPAAKITRNEKGHFTVRERVEF